MTRELKNSHCSKYEPEQATCTRFPRRFLLKLMSFDITNVLFWWIRINSRVRITVRIIVQFKLDH
jgi:hypothetical protein